MDQGVLPFQQFFGKTAVVMFIIMFFDVISMRKTLEKLAGQILPPPEVAPMQVPSHSSVDQVRFL